MWPYKVLHRILAMFDCLTIEVVAMGTFMKIPFLMQTARGLSGEAKGPASPTWQDRNIFQFHIQNTK